MQGGREGIWIEISKGERATSREPSGDLQGIDTAQMKQFATRVRHAIVEESIGHYVQIQCNTRQLLM